MFIILFSLVVLLWLIASFFLTGEDLSKFDKSLESSANNIFDSHSEDQENNQKMILRLGEARQQAIKTKSIFKGLQVARDFADELSIDLVTDTEFRSVNANNVECEWAIAPDVDMSKRVVFFHGGAFLLGSAKGHRKLADQLSRLSNAPVLSVNYRMLPKHSRMLGIKDAQHAYLWALDNGPDGKQALDFIMVSGDSAGGNLAHMVTQWSIKNAPRKPNCLISFSPSLDQTFTSPSLISNQASDPILGAGLSLLTRLPKAIRLWLLTISMRANPSNPLVSPVFGDLSDLPPTLIHASSSEMLLGESIRYANKAREQGADIRLQVWQNQIHDWPLFNMGYGSANVAWNEVAKFISDQLTSEQLIYEQKRPNQQS